MLCWGNLLLTSYVLLLLFTFLFPNSVSLEGSNGGKKGQNVATQGASAAAGSVPDRSRIGAVATAVAAAF